jgi:hypothetical protein
MKRQITISPVALGGSASVAVCVGSLIIFLALPGHAPSYSVANKWLRVLLVEAACVIPLFFLYKDVRRAEWLWALWLIAAVQYTSNDLRLLWRWGYSLVVVATCLGWFAKAVVAMIILMRGTRPLTLHSKKTPSDAPEPTPGSATPRAT